MSTQLSDGSSLEATQDMDIKQPKDLEMDMNILFDGDHDDPEPNHVQGTPTPDEDLCLASGTAFLDDVEEDSSNSSAGGGLGSTSPRIVGVSAKKSLRNNTNHSHAYLPASLPVNIGTARTFGGRARQEGNVYIIDSDSELLEETEEEEKVPSLHSRLLQSGQSFQDFARISGDDFLTNRPTRRFSIVEAATSQARMKW